MPRIDQIELRHISMPLVAPFETSFGREADRECILVVVRAEGLTGWGECVASPDPGYCYETIKTAWHVLSDFLIPRVLGREFEDMRALIATWKWVRGHPLAKAGLQMAFWDLLAQECGASLQQVLRGQGDRVKVGVSVGIQESPQALVDRVRAYLADGYPRIKIKIKPGKDVEYARAVREAFPDIPLQVDANSAYTLADAATIRAMDDLGLLLIEQPLGYDDIFDHAKLQAELKTPICLDESIHSPEHARWALEMNACRVINIKPGRVGGLFEATQIHNLCRERGVPVWCGGMLETGFGRAANLALASLPGFTLPGDISATDRYYHEDVAGPPFRLNPDGTIEVPHGRGLGVEPNWEVLERVTISKALHKENGK
jgi:O-succinylbenzoate synthase